MSCRAIALVGNPNSGKTSLFNEMTGSNQSVGNWPGVTVERKEGIYKKNSSIMIQDLPGIYSLAPYTPEEVIARNYLMEEKPDVILNVVDGTNLERNLYLSLQLFDMGVPTVIALNMKDVLASQGKKINTDKLSYSLGVPIVETSAVTGEGIHEAIKASILACDQGEERPKVSYDPRLEVALSEIGDIIEGKQLKMFIGREITQETIRWYSMKLFERDERVLGEINLAEEDLVEIEEVVKMTEKIFEDDCESIIINERYKYITQVVKLCVISSENFQLSVSDKIDRVVTNRWLALPIFAFVMWLVYYLSIQTIGTMGTDWVNDVVFGDWVPNYLGGALAYFKVAGWMQALIIDGIVAGVGAVLGFLPQLVVLFFCLAILEDCGYMSRIAFVMDRLFRRFGLSGKSFIPMLIATGCGVPGIMASRTIENEKDRKITIMVTTFMPCSAKLPIIALIAGAFFPGKSWVAPSAYFVGMAAIVLSGILLKKTKEFSGEVSPFIMELPMYHFPRWKNLFRQTWQRSKSFVKKAGTIIFVSSIIIWFSSNYNFRFDRVSEDKSILAWAGSMLAIIFRPLGFGDWRATVATITGLVAKENVVNTFGILFGGISEVSESGHEVWPALQSAYTPLAGYSFLLFNLLCAPCFAAIGAIHREMVSLVWTLRAVAFQCGLAYGVSFVVYQLGSVFIEGHSFGFGAGLATLILMTVGYLLLRKPKDVIPKLSTI